ncbi:MAG: Uma2 family endonuclease [Chloroflexota bacterium]|nr:Uma2 family endonuclease [Chloroflexota bacterium]
MTTAKPNTISKTPQTPDRFRLPDIPEREPDEVTQYDQLFDPGHAHHLIQHLGNLDTTLVTADRWIIVEPGTFRDLARYPDLMIAFGVDPELYRDTNGYIISEQGKPPDFVLEVASPSTGGTDTGAKRDDYERMGILEYWRFDQTGQHHGTRLAGDRLVGGAYRPMRIDELDDGSLQGYSPILNLHLRWEDGVLAFYDSATGRPILTYADQLARANAAEARANTAEARVRELEDQLRRLRDIQA